MLVQRKEKLESQTYIQGWTEKDKFCSPFLRRKMPFVKWYFDIKCRHYMFDKQVSKLQTYQNS